MHVLRPAMRKLIVFLLSLTLSASADARTGDRDNYCVGSVSYLTLDTPVTSPTPNASANTEGSWAQAENSTSTRIDQLDITIRVTGPVEALCDIGVDTAGGTSYSEYVSNLAIQGMSTAGVTRNIRYVNLPVAIPSGSSIATRCQASGASVASLRVMLIAKKLRRATLSNPITYGAVDASSNGTAIDPGATPNTLVYAQVSAATSTRLRQLWIRFGAGDYSIGASAWGLNVSTGTAPGTLLFPTGNICCIRDDANAQADTPDVQVFGPFPVDIPAGTELNAAALEALGVDGDRDVNMIIYGSSEPFQAPCE